MLLYLFYQASNVYKNIICRGNIKIFKEQFNSQSTGEFCNDLINTLTYNDNSNVIFNECPNFYWHDGKELVLSLTWNGENLILKGRSIYEKEMIMSDHKYYLTDQKNYLNAFEKVINSTFLGKVTVDPDILIPWKHSRSDAIINSNLTALWTVWLLSQDNEYLLAKCLSQKYIFPEIKSTCRHFYLVESAERIMDLSYIVPAVNLVTKIYARSCKEKLDAAIKLIEFLIRFEQAYTGLELCDVKFDHFGFYQNEQILMMIDSDMIFNKQVTNESIVAIQNCSTNTDCDFIDCKGYCSNEKCLFDINDNNVKRICRNMFFMSIVDLSPIVTLDLGLLPDFDYLGYEKEMQSIREICVTNYTSQNDLLNSAQKIMNILISVKKSLYSN